MKTFKQFMLESGETGKAINPIGSSQLVPLPKGLRLEPLDDTTGKVVSKPTPSRKYPKYPAPTGAHYGKY